MTADLLSGLTLTVLLLLVAAYLLASAIARADAGLALFALVFLALSLAALLAARR